MPPKQNDTVFNLESLLNTTNAVVCALLSTVAAVWFKRRNDLSDRREAHDDHCERCEAGYKILAFACNTKDTNLQSVATLHNLGKYTDEYALNRFKEIAAVPAMPARLTAYVDGAIELGEVGKEE